ncbi:Organic cation transporter protein [Eumeta japonica]|uniref:Organic cation transporter protein n=1 Tax=Eumeta variegata TaxID=151549 RepID=A0A4C1TIC2_EUMVA|nr:Organic cation transporter protein [Eumeta japonica]
MLCGSDGLSTINTTVTGSIDIDAIFQTEEKGDGDPLEQVVLHVGAFGTYQRLLFMSILPFGLFFAFVYFVQMFITATPQRHWCLVPELAHLDLELRRNLSIPGAAAGDTWDQCVMYDADWTEVLETLVPPSSDTPTTPCRHGWEFEFEDIPYPTVTSERGWVCDRAWLVPMSQTLAFTGSLVGGVSFGWLADKFGRLPIFIASNLVGCAGGLGSVFTTGFWDFAVCRFLVGVSCDTCFMMIYIIALEYVGFRYRTLVANMSLALFFGTGCVILPWLALWMADWRRLLLLTSTPMLIVCAAPWLIPESARWLVSQGRTKEALKILREIENVNKTKIPPDVLDNFLASSNQMKSDESVLILFKNVPLRKVLLLMICAMMTCALLFDGLVRLSETLGGDFFVTFTLTSATEIPSTAILILVLDRWGRRWLMFGPMSLVGVLCICAAFMPRGLPTVAMAVVARFFTNMSYNTAIQWSTELLPTGVRTSGFSIIHLTGYVAASISSFVVYADQKFEALPLLLLGGVAIIGGCAGLFLPETCDKPMPQTIADGERLANSRTLKLGCGKAKDIAETT